MHAELQVEFTKFVDDSFPGFVQCEFSDALGKRHAIVDKVPVLTLAELGPESTYPQPGTVTCEIVSRYQSDAGNDLANITISRPNSLETVDGITEFVVSSSILC